MTERSLRHYRLRAGLTQEELADRTGLSVRGVANIECGRVRRPHAHSLQRLAEVLNLSAEEKAEFVRLTPMLAPDQESVLARCIIDRPEPERRLARQLPADICHFTGRQAEFKALHTYLRTASNATPPIADIAGQGGIGKTTLAVRLAHALMNDFPDGQLFVAMGGSRRPTMPEAVLSRFLRALGMDCRVVAAADLDERAAYFRSTVAQLKLLIVLDDVSDEDQIRPLLPGTGLSATIVTSRGRLFALESARIFDVPLFSQAESRALISRLASPARTGAETDATNDIVRSCGGLPLAVRIAGARLAAEPKTPIRAVAQQLRDERQRLDALRVGDRAVRTTIQLGYDALTEDGRRALRLLTLINPESVATSVLARLLNCTTAASSSIAERLSARRLLEVIDSDPLGRPRYAIHDLVRIFASERSLIEDDNRQRRAAQVRALDLLRDIAESITDALPATPWAATPDRRAAAALDDEAMASIRCNPRAWYAADRSNLIGGIRSALTSRLTEPAWKTAQALASPSMLYGDYDQLRDVATHVHTACRDNADGRGAASMVSLLAGVDLNVCDYRSSFARFTTAYQLFDDIDDTAGMAFTATFATDAARALREYDRGCDIDDVLRWARRAMSLSEGVDDAGIRVDLAYVLGKLFMAAGDLDRARTEFELCRGLAAEMGKPATEAHAVFRLGTISRLTGQRGEALSAYRRALEVTRYVGDRPGVGYLTLSLASLLQEQGLQRNAAELAHEALHIFGELRMTQKEKEARLLAEAVVTRSAERPDAPAFLRES